MLRETVLDIMNAIRKRNKAKFFDSTSINVQFTGQKASDIIFDGLMNEEPFLVARFGFFELDCVIEYLFKEKNKNFYSKYLNFIAGLPYSDNYSNSIREKMRFNAGFFPSTDENLDRFSELMLYDIGIIDILGSWLHKEKLTYRFFKLEHSRVGFEDLPPFNCEKPWSAALEGKKVLVVHPFSDTISKQYLKREFLFKNLNVLPKFELKTLKAVQTIAANSIDFQDWFDALNYMKNQVDQVDYDVAIIGCGAYGLPLAAHVKRMGKKAIHLGGVTQCLFGIIGKRWETEYDYKERFVNQYWVRPSQDEVPYDAQRVEDGCYW